MPRKPRVRVNYQADSQYLTRLAFAVSEDERMPVVMRQDLAGLVADLARKFQGVPVGEEKTKEAESQEAEEIQVIEDEEIEEA